MELMKNPKDLHYTRNLDTNNKNPKVTFIHSHVEHKRKTAELTHPNSFT